MKELKKGKKLNKTTKLYYRNELKRSGQVIFAAKVEKKRFSKMKKISRVTVRDLGKQAYQKYRKKYYRK